MVDVPYLMKERGTVPRKRASDQAVHSGRHSNRGLESAIELPQGHVVSGADRPTTDIVSHPRPPVKVVCIIRHLLLGERLVQRFPETRKQSSLKAVRESISASEVQRPRMEQVKQLRQIHVSSKNTFLTNVGVGSDLSGVHVAPNARNS